MMLSLPFLAASAINLNQLGFRPDDPKRAVIADAATRALDWVIVDENGRTVQHGRNSVGVDDPASGDHVHVATFTPLDWPGTYRLRVDGTESGPFRIAHNVYAPLALNALNLFYQQRAGTPIAACWAGAR
jgi:endoglucanase